MNEDNIKIALITFRLVSDFSDIKEFSAELLKLIGEDKLIDFLSRHIADLRDYLAEQSAKLT